MTNLARLKVSLTKHGAHKVAELVKAFPRNKILPNTWDKYKDIRIDDAQTIKNLSISKYGDVPDVWDEVRQLGGEYVNDLVLVAIIFSHHKLIETMIDASTGVKKGTVERGDVIDGKEYTNFAHVLDELGFANSHNKQRITYDLSRIFEKFDLIAPIVQLLTTKIKEAHWQGDNDFIDECISLNFHKVFGVSKEYFRNWLQKGTVEDTEEAEEVEETVVAEPKVGEFEFKKGHTTRSEADAIVKKASPKLKATLLHNKIQNKLHEYLSKKYSEEKVGTEQNCGNGTIIDVVRQIDDGLIFYEIKTAKTTRMCIRQALSQLLEYSYWPDRELAKQIIIVSQNEITEQSKKYLAHLRKKFKLPIYYQQFDLETGELAELY